MQIFSLREGVEDALVHQRGDRHRLLEGLADAVPQIPFLEPRAGVAGRVDVHDRAEFLGLFPEWPQGGVTQFHVARGGRDADAGEAEVAHAAREFRNRKRRRGERHAAEADQPLRIGGDDRRHAVVEHALQPQAFRRLGPIGELVHEARRQHLHVDPHGVHVGDAVGHVRHARHHKGLALADHRLRRLVHGRIGVGFHEHAVRRRDGIHFRDHQVGVEVDDATERRTGCSFMMFSRRDRSLRRRGAAAEISAGRNGRPRAPTRRAAP